MTESQVPPDDLADEFRHLGKNILDALAKAWERPERKQLQQEIIAGLTELTDTLKKEVDQFQESPSGQQLKTDIEDLRQRVRSGEAEATVRAELVKALRIVNAELEKVASRLGNREPSSPEGE